MRELCFLRFATILKNWDECENIKKIDIKNKCYYWAQNETLDPEFCEKLVESSSDDISLCYARIAKAKDDRSVCELLENRTERGYCYTLMK
jgi:hypothetical protein